MFKYHYNYLCMFTPTLVTILHIRASGPMSVLSHNLCSLEGSAPSQIGRAISAGNTIGVLPVSFSSREHRGPLETSLNVAVTLERLSAALFFAHCTSRWPPHPYMCSPEARNTRLEYVHMYTSRLAQQ